ncbi:MAG TPA: hypothetical protein VLD58_16040 [Gemmatimonadales bacterium]|nr:hypothetical protein [Gemmatimonadales bacterium]
MPPRPTPFDIAFGSTAGERFARMRESLAATGRDPHDLDAFVLDREVVGYLRELVPEEGVGEAIEQHVALLHHAYLYWAEGAWTVRLSRDRTRSLLTAPATDYVAPGADLPRASYIQFPERLIWAPLAPDEPHQPLDGIFVRPWPSAGFFLLAVFGLHPGQDAFAVVDVDGYRELKTERDDGTPLFAPVLPGGEAAGLFSIVGGDELLELAARTVPLLAEAVSCAGAAHQPHHPVDLS